MYGCTGSPPTRSEAYYEFLELDLAKVRKVKNWNREPFAMLFELEREEGASAIAVKGSKRGIQEGSYKRRKLSSDTELAVTPTSPNDDEQGTWHMYTEAKESNLERITVHQDCPPTRERIFNTEEEKENIVSFESQRTTTRLTRDNTFGPEDSQNMPYQPNVS